LGKQTKKIFCLDGTIKLRPVGKNPHGIFDISIVHMYAKIKLAFRYVNLIGTARRKREIIGGNTE
jgi:hypothetical protein